MERKQKTQITPSTEEIISKKSNVNRCIFARFPTFSQFPALSAFAMALKDKNNKKSRNIFLDRKTFSPISHN